MPVVREQTLRGGGSPQTDRTIWVKVIAGRTVGARTTEAVQFLNLAPRLPCSLNGVSEGNSSRSGHKVERR